MENISAAIFLSSVMAAFSLRVDPLALHSRSILFGPTLIPTCGSPMNRIPHMRASSPSLFQVLFRGRGPTNRRGGRAGTASCRFVAIDCQRQRTDACGSGRSAQYPVLFRGACVPHLSSVEFSRSTAGHVAKAGMITKVDASRNCPDGAFQAINDGPGPGEGDDSLDTIDHASNFEGYTVKDALEESISLFEEIGVPESRLSACHLLSDVLNLPTSNGFSILLRLLENEHSHGYCDDCHSDELPERVLTDEEARRFQSICRRRSHHEPIQYILGEWDFYDFTLKCRAPVLCPRPETEELVDWVCKEIAREERLMEKNSRILLDATQRRSGVGASKDRGPAVQLSGKRRVRILDVGCGTGAIGLALAKRFPEAEVVAIDISKEAVELAMENALILGLVPANDDHRGADVNSIGDAPRCRYRAIVCSARDFTNGGRAAEMPHETSAGLFLFEFDYVVSNPPYIPPSDISSLSRDVLDYESLDALCGGDNDGLNVIRDIIERLPEWTADSTYGRGELYMEVDTSHPTLLKRCLSSTADDQEPSHSDVQFVETRKDLYGRDRFVKLQVCPDLHCKVKTKV